MSSQRDVAVIVGSLRKGSFSRLTARTLAASAPESLKMEIVEIRDLSLYDQDLDGSSPAPWLAFKERIKQADAVLFVTPETTGRCPGC